MTTNDLTNDVRNDLRQRGWIAVVVQQYAINGRERGTIVSRHRSYEAACRRCDDMQRVEFI